MNHHERPEQQIEQMERAEQVVTEDDPNTGQKLAALTHSAKNSVACAVYAGDLLSLDLLKPQTTVAIDDSETDDSETDDSETAADDSETLKTKRHISRYRPGTEETTVVRRELNLVDIETPTIENEASVFIGDLNATAAYAVHIAPAIIQMAPTYDAFCVVKNSALTNSESDLIRETISELRDLRREGELPLYYLHHNTAEASPETTSAQYAANIEKLQQSLPGGFEAFQCENLDTSDEGYQAFRRSWEGVVEIQRDRFVNEIWTEFIKEIQETSEAYQRFLERMDGYSDLQERIEKYQAISAEQHPTESLSRLWEDVGYLSRYQVSQAFSGNNGKETLYDIALRDLPEGADTDIWDQWHVVKSTEILQAYMDFMVEVATHMHQEYVRVHREAIDQFLEALSTAGITTETHPSIVSAIQAKVDDTLKLRELSPSNLTSTVEEYFRYGFMAYLIGSLTLTTASWVALFLAGGKAGSEAAAAASPLGPVGAILAFSVGAIIGIVVSKMMIDSQNSKAYRAEAAQQVSRLLGALQTEATSARENLWVAYKRILEDQRKEIQTSIHKTLTDESKAYTNESKAYQDLSPEALEELRNQKRAVINTLAEIIEASEASASEDDDEDDDEKHA